MTHLYSHEPSSACCADTGTEYGLDTNIIGVSHITCVIVTVSMDTTCNQKLKLIKFEQINEITHAGFSIIFNDFRRNDHSFWIEQTFKKHDKHKSDRQRKIC